MARIDHPDLDRSLSDKAYDFLGDLLLQAETEKLLNEISQDQANGDTAEMDAFFARQDQHNLKQIHRHFRVQSYKKFFTKTLPMAAQFVAVMIAVITLAGGVAIATSHTVRVHVMQLLYQIEDEYTTLRMVEDESASFDVPAEWQGSSYMSYVPEGYTLQQVVSLSDYYVADYADASTGKTGLRYLEFGMSFEANIDTEDAEISEVEINNYIGVLSVKGNDCSVFWCDGRKYYWLEIRNGSTEELLQIARSVVKIK